MSATVRDWLPLDIVAQTSVRAALAEAVEAWSAHWFAGRRVSVGSVVAAPSGSARAESGWFWTRFGQAVAINRANHNPTPFSGWLLDGGGDSPMASAADRLILDELEDTVLADLALRVEAALDLTGGLSTAENLPDPLQGGGGAIVGLREASGLAVLRLAIPLAVLALFRKARLPKRPASGRLDTRLEALGGTTVSIDAWLGDVQLSLSDLRSMAAGDVLVLNTRLDGLAELALEGATRPLARGRVSQTDSGFSLTVQD